jgi:hypothetical protein
MFYRCKHFRVEELVPPRVFNRWGIQSWWFIDQELCQTIDEIRELFGTPITINNWLWGGNFSQSGYRDDSSEYYNEFSAHSFGKAADMKIRNIQSDVAIQMIIDWKKEGKLKYLTRIELATDGWVHVDVFNAKPNDTNKNLYVFYP